MPVALRLAASGPDDASRKKSRELALGNKLAPTFESFSQEHSTSLLGVCRNILERASNLLSYVDDRRDVARLSGVETIAVELSSIMEGGRMDRLLDALERSTLNGKPAQISLEGLQTLRRSERLLAEAADSILRFAGPVALEERRQELQRADGHPAGPSLSASEPGTFDPALFDVFLRLNPSADDKAAVDEKLAKCQAIFEAESAVDLPLITHVGSRICYDELTKKLTELIVKYRGVVPTASPFPWWGYVIISGLAALTGLLAFFSWQSAEKKAT